VQPDLHTGRPPLWIIGFELSPIAIPIVAVVGGTGGVVTTRSSGIAIAVTRGSAAPSRLHVERDGSRLFENPK